MFVFGANIKQVATGNAPWAIVKDMQAISPPYQYQFAELVGMLGEDILRITVGNRYRLRRRGKNSSLRRIS